MNIFYETALQMGDQPELRTWLPEIIALCAVGYPLTGLIMGAVVEFEPWNEWIPFPVWVFLWPFVLVFFIVKGVSLGVYHLTTSVEKP